MQIEGFGDASDERLLDLVAAADRRALEELYRRHAPWLMARISRRCADATIVHDTVQDTFVAVWRGAGRYDGRGEVAAWMWGIAIRRLIGQFRKAGRAAVPLTDNDQAEGALISAEELVLLGVEHGDLAGALDGLSPELRAVVQATVLDGLTTREAGALLGIPSGTVKTRMRRARLELREALT